LSVASSSNNDSSKQNLINDLVTTFNYDNNNIDDLSIPGLSLELKPYQKAAVHWMIKRENIMRENEDHPMYDYVKTKWGK